MPKKADNLLQLPPGIKVRGGKFHYRFQVAGLEYAASTGLAATEHNLKSAARKLEQAKQAVDAGDSPQQLQPRPFSSAAASYLDWKAGECKASTLHRVTTSFASLKAFFGTTMVHHVLSGNIEDYKAWRRAQKVKPVTLRHDLHALSGFLKYARRQQWCKHDPLEGVTIPSDAEAQREHVVTRAEELAYFAAVAKHKVLHDVARIVLETGLRPGEVLALQPRDVDLEGQTLRVRSGKTKAAKRTLHINPAVIQVLAPRVAGKAATARLFIGERGRTKKLMDGLDKTHGKVMEKLKMHWNVYELRHTYATRLAAAGCPLPTLAAILGHASLRCVGRYVHVQHDQIEAWSGLSGFCPAGESILVNSGAFQGVVRESGSLPNVSGNSNKSADLRVNTVGGADRS